jgi:uncharacterized protein HemY
MLRELPRHLRTHAAIVTCYVDCLAVAGRDADAQEECGLCDAYVDDEVDGTCQG